MGDVALEIRETLNLPAMVPPMTLSATIVAQPVSLRRLIIAKVAALVLIVAVTSLITWFLFRPSPPQALNTINLSIPLMPAQRPDLISVGRTPFLLSPDGKLLVLGETKDEKTQLYVRSLDNFEAKPIPGTENAYDPFFSPDGQWLAFFTEDAPDKHSLWKVKIDQDGQKVFLQKSPRLFAGGSWSDDNTIVFCGVDDANSPTTIFRASTDGGTAESLTSEESGSWNRRSYPRSLPDSKTVICGLYDTAYLLSLETGKSTVLIRNAVNVQYSPTGHLLFIRDRQLFAVPFDVDMLKRTGPEVLVIRNVLSNAFVYQPYFSIARNGTLAYVPFLSELPSLVWVDREGYPKPVTGAPERNYVLPRLSPNETHLAFAIYDKTNAHVWKYDISQNFCTQLTFDEGIAVFPCWIPPDGRRISFAEGGRKMFWVSADDSDKLEPLLPESREGSRMPYSWSPDGKYLAYRDYDGSVAPGIWILPFGDDGKPGEPALLDDTGKCPMLRPSDGRRIAYYSDKTGRNEIYIKEFLWGNLGEGEVKRISSEGGTEPCWSRDGKKLFYRSAKGMVEVAIDSTADGTIDVSKSQVLFEDSDYENFYFHGLTNYDVTSDERFLMVKRAPSKQINVILNWSEELKRLAPPGRK